MRSARKFLAEIWAKLLVLVIAAVCSVGCAHPKATLVVTVGGLGFSQMHDLRMAVKQQCPNVDVVSAGAWDAYKEDILTIAREKPRQHIILVGHSFGCESIDKAAAQLPNVDLAVFIDPSWDDFVLAPTIRNYLWYQRSSLGIERQAKIAGASGARVIKGGHNDLPHSTQVISELVKTINAIAPSNSAKPSVVRGPSGIAQGS
jgi:hypothetical protein